MVFQSTHPSRGATVSSIGSIQTLRFQSTHPSRGATCGRRCETGISKRFNPRTPRGVRPCISSPCSMCSTSFNPRTPRGVRRRLSRADTRGHPVSIHAHLAGCEHGSIWRSPPFTVSIHAPLAGCDFVRQAAIHRCRRFNPRTPRGVRHLKFIAHSGIIKFQSTHPSRGATQPQGQSYLLLRSFNPRTPRGVRLKLTA